MPLIASIEQMQDHAASPYRCPTEQTAAYYTQLIEHFSSYQQRAFSLDKVKTAISRFEQGLPASELAPSDELLRQRFALQIVLDHDSW